MTQLPKIMVAERQGGRDSPLDPRMQQPRMGRASILADGEHAGEFLAADILRSLGKNTSHGRLKALSEGGFEEARIWLGAEEISDLFVGHAENLNIAQMRALIRLSANSRIWLLFSDSVPREFQLPLKQAGSGSIGPNSLRRWLAGKHEVESEAWRDFPELPRSGPLTFRADCADVNDAFAMMRIDGAITRGVDSARLALDQSDSPLPESVAKAGLDATVPTWPGLAMLRGAQLGALSMGWALRFDTTSWLEMKSVLPTLTNTVLRAIRETAAPTDGALVILYAVTGGSPTSLAALNVDNVSPDAAEVQLGNRTYDVPRHAQPVLAAHREFVNPDKTDGPLFPTSTGARSKRGVLSKRLTRALLGLGLAPAIELTEAGISTRGHTAQLADQLRLKLTKLPNT